MNREGDSAVQAGRLVQVFRSARREGMYLMVDRAEGVARVPESLLGSFGRPEPSLVFMLTPTRTLAAAEAPEVLAAIAAQGFWLQMPPAPSESDNARELREGSDGYETREPSTELSAEHGAEHSAELDEEPRGGQEDHV